MRIKQVFGLAILLGFATTMTVGCGGGTDVPLKQEPVFTPPPAQPLPKEPKKGGGAGSSGNMKFNPGAST